MATGKLPYSESLPYAGTLTATKPVTKQSIVNTVPTSQAATTVDYMQPIERLFEPRKYIEGLARTKEQSDKEYKWLSALGYALQLGNPNFKPNQYLQTFKADQMALAEEQWQALQNMDKLEAEKEGVRVLSLAKPQNAAEAAQILADKGILGIDISKRILDHWKSFQPEGAKAPTLQKYKSGGYEIAERWDEQQGKMVEVARSKITPQTEVRVDLGGPGQTELDKKILGRFGDVLNDSQNLYRTAVRENSQIEEALRIINSDEMIDPGILAPAMLRSSKQLYSILQTFGGENIFGKYFSADDWAKKIGSTEWFDAISKEFGANKLQLTKGAVSDREMQMFLDMAPNLSKTPEGNIRLLKMMRGFNNALLAEYQGAQDINQLIIQRRLEGKDELSSNALRSKWTTRINEIRNKISTEMDELSSLGDHRYNAIPVASKEEADLMRARGELKSKQWIILPNGQIGQIP